jgi:hypothetical protein
VDKPKGVEVQVLSRAQNAKKSTPFGCFFRFVSLNDVFAIYNAKTNEVGQEVLNEQSEFRNLRQTSGCVNQKYLATRDQQVLTFGHCI